MHQSLLDLLRCPYCGTRLSLVDNDALVRAGDDIESGVLGCECCAYPVMAGIPVMMADDATREAMHTLEAGRPEEALLMLLGVDDDRAEAFRALVARGAQATYREALEILSRDAEGSCFLYRFSDPTYVVAEALLQAAAQQPWLAGGRWLDLCGGSGHLTRTMVRRLGGAGSRTVLADLFFWKLWLAARFVSPGCAPVCCDANQPLPFARETFATVVLSDAFPYIWHKRLLAEEMMRLAGPDGAIVMPHLHSALGENHSAGNTLTPAAYHDLFAPMRPRLFSDERLFELFLAGLEREPRPDDGRPAPPGRQIDLTLDRSPSELGDEPSFTLVASRRADLFRRYDVPEAAAVTGELALNPLYRVERRGAVSVLTLTFPTPEYEDEFAACRRYLPETLTIEADLTGPILPETLGAHYQELRRRRVVLDAPPHYARFASRPPYGSSSPKA